MRIALAVSTDYEDSELVLEKIARFPPGTVVLALGRIGTEKLALAIARQNRLEVIAHGPSRRRANQMVSSANFLVIFWSGGDDLHVTRAIRASCRMRVDRVIFGPHGERHKAREFVAPEQQGKGGGGRRMYAGRLARDRNK